MSAFEIEWEALIVAAKAEGELQAFLCCALGRKVTPVIEAFEAEFGISLVSSTGSSRNQVAKVIGERDAGKYTLDVWAGGARTSNTQMRPAGMLDPVKPLLIHPEVLDQSTLLTGRFEWSDLDTRNTILGFAANGATATIAYNTNLIPDPSVIKSYYDLLDPKYKGLIVAGNDPRAAGTGTTTAFYFGNEQLGPEFLTRLLTETDLVIAADPLQAVNALAKGTYALCIFNCSTEAEDAKADGLPVEPAWPFVLKEGVVISVGGANIMALNKPANPNAQKLFINWFLSRAGQIAFQEGTGDNSMRIDIPKDTVLESNRRLEGFDYLLLDTQSDYQDTLAAAMAVSEEALRSVGK